MTTLETICIINNEQINNNILEVSNNTLNVKKTLKVIKFDKIIKNNSINDNIIKNDIYSTIGSKKNTTYFLLGKKNEEKLMLNIITDMIIEYSLSDIPFNIYIHAIDFNSIRDLLRNEEIQINNNNFDNTKLHINPLNKIEVDDALKLVISCILNKNMRDTNCLSKMIFSIENQYQRVAVYDLLEDKGNTIFLHENYYINTELYYIELYFLKTENSILQNSKLVTLLDSEMRNNCKFILNYVNEHKFISLFDVIVNYYQKYSYKVNRPLQNDIIPLQILPLQNAIIPLQNAIIPLQILPSQNAIIPLQILPSQNAIIPSQNAIIPSEIPPLQIVIIPSQDAMISSQDATLPVTNKYTIEDEKKLLTQLSIYNRCLFDNTVKYHLKIQKARNSVELYESFDEIKDEMYITLKLVLDKLTEL